MYEIISINFDEMPDLFKDSEVYKALVEHKKQLQLFSNSCNFDLRLHNYKELCATISTLTYWRFNKTPIGFYHNILGRENALKRILLDNEHDLSLRFETNRIFWELGIMVLCDSREQRIESAKYHKLNSLVEFLEKNC
jgi:hypothetical protein